MDNDEITFKYADFALKSIRQEILNLQNRLTLAGTKVDFGPIYCEVTRARMCLKALKNENAAK